MNRAILAFGVTLAWLSSGQAADETERKMNVSQGPETVFAVQPGEIFAELADAVATNENGRVGNELVFWGYRLADGRQAFLSACAMLEGVDCESRELRVCPDASEPLRRTTTEGLVRNVRCVPIAIAAPGDVNPGCTAHENPRTLAVSLLVC